MDVAQELTLPQIPLLRGKDNFELWQTALVQTFRYYGITDYLFKTPTEMVKHEKLKAFAMVLITNSVGPVMHVLVQFNWSSYQIDKDPKVHYDLICRVIPTVRDWDQVVKELTVAKAREFSTLSEFKTRVQHLRLGVSRELEHDDKTWGVPAVVMALRDGREMWHHALVAEMNAGRLTWQRLMRKIDAQAAYELTVSKYDDEDDDSGRNGNNGGGAADDGNYQARPQPSSKKRKA